MADLDLHNTALMKLLESINSQLANQSEQIRDVRERLIRLESHGYAQRLGKVEDELDAVRNRITILETKGQTTTAVIGSAAAVLTTAVTSAVLYLFGR